MKSNSSITHFHVTLCQGLRLVLTPLCILLTLSACQDYDMGYTSTEISYHKAFIEEFGAADPNHDWGFIEQPILDYSAPQTRVDDTNKGLWYYTYQLNIPGYPDADGYFHGTQTVDGDGYLTKGVSKDQIPNVGTQNEDKNWLNNNVGEPVGDVTAEEREWVYNWFATHQNPPSESIHWSDFFIQYVHSHKEHERSNRNMDQLGYEGIITSWEHVNNFNVDTHAMQYVYNAGTENWTYRASHSNTYQYDKYNIQYLSFDVNGHHYEGWYIGFDYESIKGDSGDVLADGFFNDWIVKVSPGTHQGYPVSVRVMCEDLGHTFDWDFNDVVFDVSFSRDEVYWPEYKVIYTATIAVQAAGGTMPICIGTQDERYEVHKLLGDGSMTPILHPGAPAVYRIELDATNGFGSNNTANAKIIPIFVNGVDASAIIGTSEVAQKFACPDYVQWSEECVNICETYPNVPAWIQNADMVVAQDLWTNNPKKDEEGQVVVTQ